MTPPPMLRLHAILLALAMLIAGCAKSPEPETNATELGPAVVPDILQAADFAVPVNVNFTESVVDAAVGFTNDLYEPTMEVSDTGVIYVTGHTILADTTGAPVFFSKDDGKSWDQLPFTGPVTMPEPMHGATPPPSDEIFLVAGDDGQLWGVDITLLTFPVNGWCSDGAELCYHNPNAYDEVQAQTTRVDAVQDAAGVSEENTGCSIANLNDRPWAAYGDGKLLMVNNPGGGPVQVGVLDVPPALPVGGPQVQPGAWNLCAGAGGGFIPGIPGMRDDHFFAVPQVQGDELVIVKGNAADVMDVEQITVFSNTNIGDGTTNYGQVVFDHEGTMFVGIRNNTEKKEADSDHEADGQLHLAVSQDNGTTFVERTLRVGPPTTSIYMDGNMAGPGALLTWAQEGEDGTDWYMAHLFVGSDGGPVVENVTLIVDEGPPPSAHVQGAAAGPDGRAYIVTFHGGYRPVDQATPLHVWIQQDGPTLPVTAAPTSVAAS